MPFTWPIAQINDRFLVTTVGTAGGQRIMNTFWYTLAEIIGVPTVEEVMDELEDSLDGAGSLFDLMQLSMPSEYTMVEAWVQRVDPIRLVKKVYTQGNAGSQTGTCSTFNTGFTITRRGVTAARNNLSSLHILCNNDTSNVLNGLIIGGLVTTANNLAAFIPLPVTTTSGNILLPIIRHGVGELNFSFIGSAAVQLEARVMRRRTVGVGI